MTYKNYKKALVHLKACVSTFSDNLEYKIVDKTTNNWKKFKQDYKDTGCIEISNEGNENTIFNDPYINQLSRVWHDKVHLKLNVGFQPNEEVQVGEYQCKQVQKYLTSCGVSQKDINNTQLILMTDIVSQAIYYEENNKFVPHQQSFVINELLNK